MPRFLTTHEVFSLGVNAEGLVMTEQAAWLITRIANTAPRHGLKRALKVIHLCVVARPGSIIDVEQVRLAGTLLLGAEEMNRVCPKVGWRTC